MISNLVLSTISIIFSLSFLILSFQIPESGTDVGIGASGWPKIILDCMLFIGCLLWIRSIREYFKYRKTSQIQRDHVQHKITDNNPDSNLETEWIFRHRYWINIVLIILYIIAIEYLGFIVTTILFLIAGIRLNGWAKWSHNLMISFFSVCLFVVIFILLLQLPLPRGMGMFRELSYFLY